MLQLTLWSVPPLLAILVGVGAYLHIREKTRVPGQRPLMALLVAVVVWAGGQLTATLLTDLPLKMLAWKFAYVGIVLAPVLWFIFALSYTRRQMQISRVAFNGILLIPLATITLIMTNEAHHLVWSNLALYAAQGYVGMVAEYGIWFYVHAAYSYCLLIAATSLLAYAVGQRTADYKPVLSVILAPLLVLAANLFYLSPFNPAPWFDLTTLGFAAGAIILNNGVLRYGVLDSLPVVRERVVEQLRDGVVVLDHKGFIIDINVSALTLFDAPRENLADKNVCEFVTTLELDDLLGRRTHQSLGVTMGERSYDISATVIDRMDPESNVVLVFRDITTLRKTERELRETRDKLDRLAHTDSLTSLSNRRFFMERLNEEVERVRRHGSQLSVLLLDLDHFKRVNDSFGHDAGDRILRAVATVCTDVTRLTDLAARIGGEEFALLLPETDLDGAMRLARRLREGIEDMRTTHSKDRRIKVTASIGVANVTQHSHDIDNVLKHADKALYKAKHLGRNRVCYAPPVLLPY